jgi:hypothetical protein
MNYIGIYLLGNLNNKLTKMNKVMIILKEGKRGAFIISDIRLNGRYFWHYAASLKGLYFENGLSIMEFVNVQKIEIRGVEIDVLKRYMENYFAMFSERKVAKLRVKFDRIISDMGTEK